MGSRRACIDIGSNTTRLLVAERIGGDRLRYVHEERTFTRIGRAVRLAGEIPQPKLEEVARVVSEQVSRARRLGSHQVRGVATAAIRQASNGAALAQAIHASCGLEVEILSAEREARLAFKGATATLGGELGVVDVGGASSELAVGTAPDRLRWWASLPIGSGDLADQWLQSDPPSARDIDRAREQVALALSELTVPRPTRTIAVGGSASSMARLVGPLLDEQAFARSIDVLCSGSADQVGREEYELDPERVRLLPAGLLILEQVARRFGTPLVIGRGGVREGVLLETVA